jgi:hypothetical protein
MSGESRLSHMAVLLAFAVSCVVVAASPARATPPETSRSDTVASILAEENDTERRVVGLSRFRLSFPQRFSAAVGAMWVRQPVSYDCSSVCKLKGPFVQVEPGYSGGQLSAGYAVVMGERGDNKHFLSRAFLGYGIRGALLRTWNDADLTPADQTLLGVEGDFSIININFSLGVFHHIGSGDPDNPWVVTGGVGWGF